MPVGNIFGVGQAGSDVDHGKDQALSLLGGIRKDVAPMFQGGANIFSMLSDPNQLMKSFYTSPDYQFRLQQGMNGVNTNQAVNGLLRSGSALKATQNFGQNLASSEFNNWWGRQTGLVGQGLQAEGLAAGAAGDQAKYAMQGAEDQGNLDLAQGNNISNLMGSLFSSYG